MLLSEIFNSTLTENSVEDTHHPFQDPYPKDIDIDECGLTSLKGCPSVVNGHFNCNTNNLKTLKGGPKRVTNYYDCEDNSLTSLEGAPEYIGDAFYCNNNKLTSLHNIHKQIKHIGTYAYFNRNPIMSHVLGLLLIDGLKSVFIFFDDDKNNVIQKIINKHLAGDRDVFACQEDLIEAGYDEYAQL